MCTHALSQTSWNTEERTEKREKNEKNQKEKEIEMVLR